MGQSYTRVLSSKKTPLTSVFKFLIYKGLTPSPELTKADLCMVFKSLVENQPDYTHSSANSIPSIQAPIINNIRAFPQNNNMMHVQPYQLSIEQVRINVDFIDFYKI